MQYINTYRNSLDNNHTSHTYTHSIEFDRYMSSSGMAPYRNILYDILTVTLVPILRYQWKIFDCFEF